MRITEAELVALQAGKHSRLKGNKYPATKITQDGYTFDSLSEHRRYCELLLLKKAGVIRKLRIHTPWELVVNGESIGVYTDDFNFQERRGLSWEKVIEDVKNKWNYKDRHFRRVQKLIHALYGITVRAIVR